MAHFARAPESARARDDVQGPASRAVRRPRNGRGADATVARCGLNSLSPIWHDMKSVPDSLEVRRGSTVVATTGGLVSGAGEVTLAYDGKSPRSIRLTVFGNRDTNTEWSIHLDCPSN